MAKSSRDKAAEITEGLVEALKKAVETGDRGSWKMPWNAVSGFARNGTSNRPYRGINTLLLWAASARCGFTDLRWYTFKGVKQAAQNIPEDGKALSHVRKGEQGTVVCFWKPIFGKVTDPDTGDEIQVKKGMMLKTWTVFNHAQVEWAEGEEPRLSEKELTLDDKCKAANNALTELNAHECTGSVACYVPDMDLINMPEEGLFTSGEAYTATRAHEYIHWTSPRVGRKDKLEERFGGKSKAQLSSEQLYAAEELVAEIGAAFFLAEHDIANKAVEESHKAYVMSWIQILKDDPYAIFTAVRLAKEAVAFLNGEGEETENVEAA